MMQVIVDDLFRIQINVMNVDVNGMQRRQNCLTVLDCKS